VPHHPGFETLLLLNSRNLKKSKKQSLVKLALATLGQFHHLQAAFALIFLCQKITKPSHN